jgi:hypothetical protein
MSNEQQNPLVVTPEFIEQIRVVNAACMLNVHHGVLAKFAERVQPWASHSYVSLSTPIGCLMADVDGYPNPHGFLRTVEGRVFAIPMPDGRTLLVNANTKAEVRCLEYLQKLAEKAVARK